MYVRCLQTSRHQSPTYRGNRTCSFVYLVCNACLLSTPEGQEWRHGDLPLIQSVEMTGKKFCPVGELTAAKAGEEIWVRARVHTSRLGLVSCLQSQKHTLSLKQGVPLVLIEGRVCFSIWKKAPQGGWVQLTSDAWITTRYSCGYHTYRRE